MTCFYRVVSTASVAKAGGKRLLLARQFEHLEQRLRDHIELLSLKARQRPLY